MNKITIPREELRVMDSVASAMYDHILALSEHDLHTLISGTGKVTNTNCYWIAYRMAPIMRNLAQWVLGQKP